MTYATYDAEKAYNDYIASVPENIREDVWLVSYNNAWTDEAYDGYDNDLDRWNAALDTAKMVVDYPEGYGINA